MSDLAPSVLLSIAGGYAFLQLWPKTKHRWDALEWERNLFEATLAGSILFLLTRAIVFLFEEVPFFLETRELIRAVLPFAYSGSLVATLGLGVLAGLLFRKFASDERAIRSAVQGYGGELLKILLDAAEARFPVSISLKNRKVYVGLIIASPSLSTKHLYTKVLPSVSGYRDEATLQLQFTTPYWHAYSDLRRRIAKGEQPTVDPEAFGIILPLGEIVSVNRFDEDSYVRYFSPPPQDRPVTTAEQSTVSGDPGSPEGPTPVEPPGPESSSNLSVGRFKLPGWLSRENLNTLMAGLAIYLSCAVRGDDQESAKRRRELQALDLGRTATVYETLHDMSDSLVALESITPSRRERGERELEESDWLEAAVLATIARDLNVSIATREEPWRLDSKIYPQLRARYPRRVAVAYQLGRLLGHCDERSQLVIVVTEIDYKYGTSRAVADPREFPRSVAAIDSFMSVLGCPIRMAWATEGNLWLRLAEVRAVLDAVTEWLAAAPDRDRYKDPKVDESWGFTMMLRRGEGGPKGYSTVVSPVVLTRANVSTFEDEFRRTAWMKEIPREAIERSQRQPAGRP